MGIIVDLFAGAGGASLGIEAATGRDITIAINHDATALAVHEANHPRTLHLKTDIWEVNPRTATEGQKVDVLWMSPDCTHFSVAKGGQPRQQNIRSLADVGIRWARDVRPAVIFLENVQEFLGWGPLDDDGFPIEALKGSEFKRWKGELEALGYVVDHRVLDASLFGAPTRRRRLFLVARCDGRAITWPQPTHGPGTPLPLRTAAECIDWSIPCPSIFERKKPLAEKTLWRIAQGIRKYVIENPQPFIIGCGGRAGQTGPTPMDAPVGTITAKNDRSLVVPSLLKVNHGGAGRQEARGENIQEPLSTVITAKQRGHALAAATLIQRGYGEREGQAARVMDIEQPLGTVVAQGVKQGLVSAFLAKHYGCVIGIPVTQPTGTLTTQDHHALVTATLGTDHRAEVRAFLTSYFGSKADIGQDISNPLRTVTTKDRFGLVTVSGVDYQIIDIGMRMLEPHELLAAQFGRFAAWYDLSAAKTKTAKVRLIGNSVCPEAAEAVVAANLPAGVRRVAA